MAFYTKAKRPPVLNIISLIDILCILLIFFIVTTEFKKEEQDKVQLQIQLPETTQGSKSEAPQEPVMIMATKEKKIFMGDKEISLENLTRTLKEKKIVAPDALYILKADTGIPLGFFVKVLDASKEAGIANLSLLTEDANKER